jgi:farnesyl-diphosphate farnesyltransferase
MTDDEFCIDILPRVSRTFAISIEALPEPLRTTIRVSYLLCRIVDTIEDDPSLERGRRAELFELFRSLVQDDAASPAPLERAFVGGSESHDRELCRNAGAAFRVFRRVQRPLADAARPHVLEMASGMAEYTERWRGPGQLTVLRDREDLERYCYFVAGTVGNLLTDVFIATEKGLSAATRDGLKQRSVAFGLGLQMTNIVKDVTADRARGWCFLPATFCERRGIAPEDLLDRGRRIAAMNVVRDVADLAYRNLDEAIEYTVLLPCSARDVRLFVLVPLVLALATLGLVRESPAVLEPGKTVKVSRATVASVLARADAVVQDDQGIREFCDQAAKHGFGVSSAWRPWRSRRPSSRRT